MKLTAIKCEMCENSHHISMLRKQAEWQHLPPLWLTLFPADGLDPWHFCSRECLAKWIGAAQIPVVFPVQAPAHPEYGTTITC